MTIRTHYQFDKTALDGMAIDIKISMTLREWRALLEDMQTRTGGEVSTLYSAIVGIVRSIDDRTHGALVSQQHTYKAEQVTAAREAAE